MQLLSRYIDQGVVEEGVFVMLPATTARPKSIKQLPDKNMVKR